MKRAIFLDRDGTLSFERGYIDRPEKFEIYPFTPSALKLLKDLGFLLVVITNQSGVARGFFSLETLNKVHEKMERELEKYGIKLDGIYFCPHHPSTTGICGCRKPNTGLVERACKELAIDPSASYVIGDKWSDIELGKRVGAKTILVLTGYGKMEIMDGVLKRLKPDIVAENILHASKIIKDLEEKKSGGKRAFGNISLSKMQRGCKVK